MNCDCIKKVREKLEKDFPGAELPTGFTFSDMDEKLYIPFTYLPKGRKRRKEGTLIVSYCPFCGKKVNK